MVTSQPNTGNLSDTKGSEKSDPYRSFKIVGGNLKFVGKIPNRCVPGNVVADDEPAGSQFTFRLPELKHHVIIGVIRIVIEKVDRVDTVDDLRQQFLRITIQ